MNGYQIVSEALLYTDKDLTLNLSDFENGKVNALFVIGYLGSGKTITGQQLAKKYKAKYIELDSYREDEMNKLMKERGLKDITDQQSEKLWDTVFTRLEDRIRKGNERLIIEGIDVLFIDRKLILSKAVIIKGTSILKSTYRAWVRNIKYRKDTGYRDKSIYYIMLDTVKNQRHFQRHITKFIKDVKKAQ